MGYGMDEEDWGGPMADDHERERIAEERFQVRVNRTRQDQKTKEAARGSKVLCKCKYCKEEFEARVADRKRGWAKFCSKSCKAKQQSKTSQQ